MSLFDFLKKRAQNDETKQDDLSMVILDEETIEILEEEIKNFFPKKGAWRSVCFRRSNDIAYINLPCHLRDNAWMSKLFHNSLSHKDIDIPECTIQKFMDSSETFAHLRHEYELLIVKWQINWIMGGGDNWLIPDGYNDLSDLVSEDVDGLIRGGISKTLRAIGMDHAVIEEGIEKYADIWRPVAMRRGFHNKYEPFVFGEGLLIAADPADSTHRENWIADREYQYYQKYKDLIDKYGTKTPAMQMTPEEHEQLVNVLREQNIKRTAHLEQWMQDAKKEPHKYKIHVEDETYKQ